MKKIFISYASENLAFAEKLYLQLRSIPNVEPWFDKESLLPGEIWNMAIKKAIRESDYFIILLSKNSTTKKGFVQKELREAFDILDEFLESNIFLLPIRIEDCEIHFEKLKAIQYTDFFPTWSNGIKKVLRVINPEINNIIIPQWLMGKWEGQWYWREQKREAELMIGNEIGHQSYMVIKYHKKGALSVVEQKIEIILDGDNVTIIGTDSKFLKRGNAKCWFEDVFKLKIDENQMSLNGFKIDKRNHSVDVKFCKCNYSEKIQESTEKISNTGETIQELQILFLQYAAKFDNWIATDTMLKDTKTSNTPLILINQCVEVLKERGYIDVHEQHLSGSEPKYDMLKITGKGLSDVNKL
jgi:hypothetical protein